MQKEMEITITEFKLEISIIFNPTKLKVEFLKHLHLGIVGTLQEFSSMV